MKTLLFILIFFIATTSMLAGLMLISSPDGNLMKLPLSLLKGTPFKDYFVPGIIFSFLIGTVNIVAMIRIYKHSEVRYKWAIADGFIIIVLIIAQAILIHAFHWVHFAFLVVSMLIILIAYQLEGKWVV